MGDDYIIGPTSGTGTNGTNYEIQVTDASGNLVNNGQVYSFSLPAACTNGCPSAYTPVTYTTSPTPTPTPSPTPTPTGGSCTLSFSVVNSWSGGYQLQLTVTNTGNVPLTGWSTGFTFADTAEAVSNYWNATVSQAGRQVTAVNASYNGSVSPGNSTTFGMVVNGSSSALSALTCTPK
jgi:cellulase/cellobiase CelA1